MDLRIVERSLVVALAFALSVVIAAPARADNDNVANLHGHALNQALSEKLEEHGFTGEIESTLEDRLGRDVDEDLADLGRLLFFDTILGLNDDNSCAGCHSPGAGFGDTQSIAIGVENNGVVGPDREGPRNQRRSPVLTNVAFYKTLMWNSRFFPGSGDPFDNSQGFFFPAPEGTSLSGVPHLLTAQAFIPPTETVEMAGFDAPATHDGVRDEAAARVSAINAYRKLFDDHFPSVKSGGPVTYPMIAAAIAEFEFTLTFANAPIDRFARGKKSAMSTAEKRGALLFFGKAGCVSCHAVSGDSNEMFSDFQEHNIGIPQVVPFDDPAFSNVVFDGPDANEDFGREQFTGDPADRYKFRTSPLRNISVQPTFFHNGAYTDLEDAIRHHLDVYDWATSFTTDHLDADLQNPMGPLAPVLAGLDPLLQEPIELTEQEIGWLVEFVREGLLDPGAKPKNLRKLIPHHLPSGLPVHEFQVPHGGHGGCGD
jgi:cytochrome c peroxidase